MKAGDHTLGDIVRLIDGVTESAQAGFSRLESRLDRLHAVTDESRTSVDSIDRHLSHIETREDIEKRVA